MTDEITRLYRSGAGCVFNPRKHHIMECPWIRMCRERTGRPDLFLYYHLMTGNFVLANWIISKVGGVKLHDYGCSLKAYRREVLQGFRLYGEMHRFIPIYAAAQGARVAEIPVTHHARKFGQSKYGLNRTIKVLLDLLVVKFLTKYRTKPSP